MARKQLVVVLVLLTGACTAEPPASTTSTRTPWKQPSLINEEVRAEGTRHFVRDVIDGRTVELEDGTTVRVAQLAAPADCWAGAALAFARTTLLATAVRVSPYVSGSVNLVLEDGTDYALLAVQRGVLRAEGVDGGPLLSAESEAAAADRGLWGPPCDGLDLAPPPAPRVPVPPAPGQPAPAPPVPAPAPGNGVTPPQPAPTTAVPPRPAPTTTVPPRPPARICAVAYRITGQWPGGFQVNATLRNTGSTPINGWTLRWTFSDGQTITGMWNATPRQSGATVNAANAPYNAHIPAGGSVTIGFNGAMRGGNSAPGAFTLNGQSCSVE